MALPNENVSGNISARSSAHQSSATACEKDHRIRVLVGQCEGCNETIARVAGVKLGTHVGLNVALAASENDNPCDVAHVWLNWVGRLE